MMPEITITVEPKINPPIISLENGEVKITQVVRRQLPDGRAWDTAEYTFWETMPEEQTQPLFDEKTGEQTGTETIPNPDTWYQLPKTHADNIRSLYDYISGELASVESSKITDKASVDQAVSK